MMKKKIREQPWLLNCVCMCNMSSIHEYCVRLACLDVCVIDYWWHLLNQINILKCDSKLKYLLQIFVISRKFMNEKKYLDFQWKSTFFTCFIPHLCLLYFFFLLLDLSAHFFNIVPCSLVDLLSEFGIISFLTATDWSKFEKKIFFAETSYCNKRKIYILKLLIAVKKHCSTRSYRNVQKDVQFQLIREKNGKV